jgi:hypothetical protein
MFIQRPHLVITRAALGVRKPTACDVERQVDARTCIWSSENSILLGTPVNKVGSSEHCALQQRVALTTYAATSYSGGLSFHSARTTP